MKKKADLKLQHQQEQQLQQQHLQPGEQIYEMFTPAMTEIVPKPLRLIQNYGMLTAKQRMSLQKQLGEQGFHQE